MLKKPELKIHALFSKVAEEFGLKTEDVDLIYTQFSRRVKYLSNNEPELGLHMDGLGKFLIHKKQLYNTFCYCAFNLLEWHNNNYTTPATKTMNVRAGLFIHATNLSKKLAAVAGTSLHPRSAELAERVYKTLDFSRIECGRNKNLIMLKKLQDDFNKGIFKITG